MYLPENILNAQFHLLQALYPNSLQPLGNKVNACGSAKGIPKINYQIQILIPGTMVISWKQTKNGSGHHTTADHHRARSVP